VIVLLLNTRTGTSLGVVSFVVTGATALGCTVERVGAAALVDTGLGGAVEAGVVVTGGVVGDALGGVVIAVVLVVELMTGVGGTLLGGAATVSLGPEAAVTTPTPISPTATAMKPTPSTRSGGRGPPGAGRLM